MTTNEGMLRRWSRRKQSAKAASDPPPVAAVAAAEPAQQDLPPDEMLPPDLPAIESLGVGSDYTAFLQVGVAAAVQSLALRRAWESDERIAGFRGMAEYAWDFNAPTYGRLCPTDNVAQLLRAVLEPPAPPPIQDSPVATQPTDAISEKLPGVPAPETADPEPGLYGEAERASELGGIRRHGSALPS